MNHYVYKTTNVVNGKFYIGVHSCDHNFEISSDGYIGSGVILKNAINKCGKKNFSCEVLECFNTRKLAFDAEVEYISSAIGDSQCYNLAPGGEGTFGYLWTNEQKQRLSQRMLEYYKCVDNKKKVSEAVRENWINEEYRNKVRRSLKNSWNAVEKRKKHSDLLTAIWSDPEKRKSHAKKIKALWSDPVKKREMIKRPPSEKALNGYLKRINSRINNIPNYHPDDYLYRPEMKEAQLRRRTLEEQLEISVTPFTYLEADAA